MARKRKTLPKDFKELLSEGDLEKLKKVFDKCEFDAFDNFGKRTALAFNECPHELAKWLIEKGANLHAKDRWGRTPLHNRSGSILGNITSLIELGADINENSNSKGTPLHSAALAHNPSNFELLIKSGANVNEINQQGYTPLELALKTCNNIDIKDTLKISRITLEINPQVTSKMKEFVNEIGKRFEFHRSNFNKDSVNEVSDNLNELYQLFEVVPVSKRILHDGKSLIKIKSESWEDQHQGLWDLLVPSSGAAVTIQGEVIRISGRISDELDRNGGGNWDADFKKMADTFFELIQTGTPLSPDEIEELKEIIREIKKEKEGETLRMCELGVSWVSMNPKPVKLPPVKYSR